MLSNRLTYPTWVSEHSKYLHAKWVSHLEHPNYVLRISTSKNHNQHINRNIFDSQLIRVNVFVFIIVCKTRDHYWVGAERLDAKTDAVAHSETVCRIVCKMDGVAGRATIASHLNYLLIFPIEARCFSQFWHLVNRWQRESVCKSLCVCIDQ